MSFLGKTYNTAEMPEAQSYEPLPEGWYQVGIKDAELKTTKAGTGQYISVQYTVTGPTHQGRVVFGNINIENPSPKAEEIGLRDFNALMTSCGLKTVSDTDAFIGHNLEIKLTISAQAGYEPRNEVRGYRAINGSAMPTAPANAPAAAPKGSAKAPWQK